jgi:hypothetical protein
MTFRLVASVIAVSALSAPATAREPIRKFVELEGARYLVTTKALRVNIRAPKNARSTDRLTRLRMQQAVIEATGCLIIRETVSKSGMSGDLLCPKRPVSSTQTQKSWTDIKGRSIISEPVSSPVAVTPVRERFFDDGQYILYLHSGMRIGHYVVRDGQICVTMKGQVSCRRFFQTDLGIRSSGPDGEYKHTVVGN